MWELDEYREACAELDHSLLAEKRQEVAAVLVGLLGWCGLRWLGKDTEAALYVCVMAVAYGARVYLLRGRCIHNKSRNLPLILGLSFAYIFAGVGICGRRFGQTLSR